MSFTPEQKLHHDLRHYPVRPHIGVGGVIIWEKHVLLVQRKFNPNKGLWAIPGGHLKIGEPVKEGALRECIEETGLDLEVGEIASVLDKIDYDDSGRVEYHYVLCDFWMILKKNYSLSNPPIPTPQSDALNAKFVSFTQLHSYALTPTVIQLFKNLKIW